MLREIIGTVAKNKAVVSLTALSIVTTAFLAYTASSPAEAVALAILASICQVLAGIVSVKGRADPNFVRSALGRVTDIGVKIRLAELRAQRAYEKGTDEERREALGLLSVTMSYLQDETRHSLEDWQSLNPEIVEAMTKEESRNNVESSQPQEAPNV